MVEAIATGRRHMWEGSPANPGASYNTEQAPLTCGCWAEAQKYGVSRRSMQYAKPVRIHSAVRVLIGMAS